MKLVMGRCKLNPECLQKNTQKKKMLVKLQNS